MKNHQNANLLIQNGSYKQGNDFLEEKDKEIFRVGNFMKLEESR